MENENITPAPQGSPVIQPKESKPMGALIGAIIIVLLLLVGGVYVWSTRIQPQITAPKDEQLLPDDNTIALEQSATEPDTMIDTLNSQSSSDEVTSIEADLNATDLNSIDKELQSI
ncbi:MAG: hypothetical protein NTZ13_01520 [Candidatus Parcubacteria bacterium]|nr:hypothetical protein [Candidatus Parcubacteria bacterium]